MSTQDSNIRFGKDADRTIAGVIVEQLSHRIGPDRFDLWFSDPNCIRKSSSEKFRHCISVSAENSFSLQRLQSTFGQDIRCVVDRVCGPHFQIDYCIQQERTPPQNTRTTAPASRSADIASPTAGETPANAENFPASVADSSPSTLAIRSNVSIQNSPPAVNRRRELRSFWYGEENRLAEASVAQLFERPGQFSPFFVYGPTGCGKTHLLEAIANDFRRRLKLRRSVYLSAEQFTSLFVSSLRGGSGLPLFRRKYRDLDLLVIDDVQFLAGKRATLNEFQHTIDNLIRMGKQVIVSSDRPLLELNSLGGDLNTRLTAGLTCPLRYPGLEGRIKIARQMCADRQMTLSAKVLEMICERLTRDIRRISGALNRLHALSLSTGARISPDIAHSELCDLFTMSSGNSTSLISIETAVCEFCGVKPADLKSSSRQKQVSTARMLAMYLSREYTSSAFSEIGAYFGGRSHSTAIAAQKKVAGWLVKNEGVSLPHATYPAKDVISRLESNLRIG